MTPEDEVPDIRGEVWKLRARDSKEWTVDKIHGYLEDQYGERPGLSRASVGRHVRAFDDKSEEDQAKYKVIHWGRLSDFEWSQVESLGLPKDAIPFVLRAGGVNVTLAEALYCWKLKQAAPDIPPRHVSNFLSFFWSRLRMEERGEKVDHSDIWHYISSHRWGSRDEDLYYIQEVAEGWAPPLHPVPPSQRPPVLTERLRKAHNNLYLLMWLDLDPFDPQWSRLWEIQVPPELKGIKGITIWLSDLPEMPWDPRTARGNACTEFNRVENRERLAEMLRGEMAEESTEA